MSVAENWTSNSSTGQKERAKRAAHYNEKYGYKNSPAGLTAKDIEFKVTGIKKWRIAPAQTKGEPNTTLYAILKEQFTKLADNKNLKLEAARLAFLAYMHITRTDKSGQGANADLIPEGGSVEVNNNQMTIKDRHGEVYNNFQNVEVLPMVKGGQNQSVADERQKAVEAGFKKIRNIGNYEGEDRTKKQKNTNLVRNKLITAWQRVTDGQLNAEQVGELKKTLIKEIHQRYSHGGEVFPSRPGNDFFLLPRLTDTEVDEIIKCLEEKARSLTEKK